MTNTSKQSNIIFSVDHERYLMVTDGGTLKPAKIFDKYGENLNKIIYITDLSIIRRPVLELYVMRLNQEDACYLQECYLFLTK